VALLTLLYLSIVSALSFKLGLFLHLLGFSLVIFTSLYVRFKNHGTENFFDPTVGLLDKLTVNEERVLIFGVCLASSFLIGSILRIGYHAATS